MPHVLVIDDDADLREAVADCLIASGITVTTAADGLEGLARLREGCVDVVVVDVLMPGMGGQEFVARCRAMPGGRSLPVIVSTGMSNVNVNGADARLDKPFDLVQLLEAVRLCFPSPRDEQAGEIHW